MSGKNSLLVLSALSESIRVQKLLLADTAFEEILRLVCLACVATYQRGNKILAAGNGGSAADAQHFAGELVSRFHFDRPPLSAIALTTDTSILTAIGNDYGYSDVFSRQVQGNGRVGDLFLAISTSGNSESILKAIKVAKKMGIIVVGLTGQTGGAMKELCDFCMCIPSTCTPRIQECHLIIEHTICAYIEQTLFGSIRP